MKESRDGMKAEIEDLRKQLEKLFGEYGIAIDKAAVNFASNKVRTVKLIGSENQASNVAAIGMI